MGQVDTVDTVSDLRDHGKLSLLELWVLEEQFGQQLYAVHGLMGEMELGNGWRGELWLSG